MPSPRRPAPQPVGVGSGTRPHPGGDDRQRVALGAADGGRPLEQRVGGPGDPRQRGLLLQPAGGTSGPAGSVTTSAVRAEHRRRLSRVARRSRTPRAPRAGRPRTGAPHRAARPRARRAPGRRAPIASATGSAATVSGSSDTSAQVRSPAFGTTSAPGGTASEARNGCARTVDDDVDPRHLAPVREGGDVEGVRAVGGVRGRRRAGQHAVGDGEPVGTGGLEPGRAPRRQGAARRRLHRGEELGQVAVAVRVRAQVLADPGHERLVADVRDRAGGSRTRPWRTRCRRSCRAPTAASGAGDPATGWVLGAPLRGVPPRLRMTPNSTQASVNSVTSADRAVGHVLGERLVEPQVVPPASSSPGRRTTCAPSRGRWCCCAGAPRSGVAAPRKIIVSRKVTQPGFSIAPALNSGTNTWWYSPNGYRMPNSRW